uniref:Uncharacterized protein n=1 Tax=Pipistrellus kuhlii TaxID=59472 RepID=A0A7J7QVE8_PIPKU|nr:hypothetical protein mPipKuh1_008340 [Pipistrellus kuhlii]
MFLLISERKGGERETSIMRENPKSAASCTPPPGGSSPQLRACALDWNQTQDPSVCRPTLYPLSHTGQGCPLHFSSSQLFRPQDSRGGRPARRHSGRVKRVDTEAQEGETGRPRPTSPAAGLCRPLPPLAGAVGPSPPPAPKRQEDTWASLCLATWPTYNHKGRCCPLARTLSSSRPVPGGH